MSKERGCKAHRSTEVGWGRGMDIIYIFKWLNLNALPFRGFIFNYMTEIQRRLGQYLFFGFQITEFLHKGGFRRESTWFQEVKQAEELFHGVLERGPCQQHFVFLQGCEESN